MLLGSISDMYSVGERIGTTHSDVYFFLAAPSLTLPAFTDAFGFSPLTSIFAGGTSLDSLAVATAACAAATSCLFCFSASAIFCSRRSRLPTALARRASAWAVSAFSRACSALAWWMCSMRTRLFLKTLPLTFRYRPWYRCESIFCCSRYLRSRRRRTRIRRIHRTFCGNRASFVPRRLPGPMCRPLRLASWRRLTRNREWIAVGLRMMNPSRYSLRMF